MMNETVVPMEPRAAVRLEPTTAAEAAATMRELAGSGARVAFVGGGTHTVVAPGPDEVLLSTRGLNQVIEYAPEDQTVTVEAGVTVAQLAAVLRERGQRLGLDVADPARSTIGGAIAANAFGASRLRFGSLKDLILGVSVVRADGVAARAGGKVVKNVAGFDLSKFLVGSHGTLALITAATLRVHPAAAASRAMRFEALGAAAVWEVVLAMRAAQLEPVAAIAARRADARGYDVEVTFEGVEAGVAAQVATLQRTAAARGWQSALGEAGAASAKDAAVRSGGPLRVRATMLPSEFAAAEQEMIGPLVAAFASAQVSVYPTLGIATIAGIPEGATAAAVVRARAWLEARGGSLLVETQPAGGAALEAAIDAAIEPWGTPPAAFALMQQLKSRFDPQHRLARGRFIGGI